MMEVHETIPLLNSRPYKDGTMSHLWKLDLDTIYIEIKEGAVVSVESQEQQLKEILSMVDVEKVYVIANGRHLKYIDRRAREWARSENAIRHTHAAALITPNVTSRLIGSMYLFFNKPSSPVKLFDDFNHAWRWIKKLKAAKILSNN